MSTSFDAMSLTEQQAVYQAVASRAGEEVTIQTIPDARIAQLEIELNGRFALATIVIEGDWDDYYVTAISYR